MTNLKTHIHLTAPPIFVKRSLREKKNKHRGQVFWFTGLSGSGKSTIAHAIEHELFKHNIQVTVLDGDIIRQGICSDLSFSPEGRAENIRRIAEISKIFAKQGIVCLCAFISPLREHRQIARSIVQEDFQEVFISCSLEECERRDVKGYYKLAREGKIKNYTGISAPYDEPLQADLCVKTDRFSQNECITQALEFVKSKISL